MLSAATAERRAVVTNNVRDYRVEHERLLARGETHYGVVFTFDDTLPRTKAAIPLRVRRLAELLETPSRRGRAAARTHVLP